MGPNLTSFEQLRRTFSDAGAGDAAPGFACLDSPDPPQDPLARLVLAYLDSLGLRAESLDQLYDRLCEIDEPDLAFYRTRDGLAVSQVSEGTWVLFTDRGRP